MLKYKKLIKALYCLNQIRPQNKFLIKVTDTYCPNLRLKEESGYWILYIDIQNNVIYNSNYMLSYHSSKIANILNNQKQYA